MLEKFRLELEDRYPACTVYKDVHAIVVAYSDGCRVDVSTCVFWGWSKQNTPVYLMPDGNDWWMQTSPPAHNAYIKRADERSGGKLKRTAKLLKYWRECRDPTVPISSFHIEMLLAAHRTCDGIKGYAQCVTEALQLLAERQCPRFSRPTRNRRVHRRNSQHERKGQSIAFGHLFSRTREGRAGMLSLTATPPKRNDSGHCIQQQLSEVTGSPTMKEADPTNIAQEQNSDAHCCDWLPPVGCIREQSRSWQYSSRSRYPQGWQPR